MLPATIVASTCPIRSRGASRANVAWAPISHPPPAPTSAFATASAHAGASSATSRPASSSAAASALAETT